MVFTAVHRALGMSPSEITMDLVVAAIDGAVREQADLDWKEKLPDSRDQGAKEEFAKDVAAMVNSGGGLIVFGVRENAATSAAEEIVDTGVFTDGEARRLRAIVYSAIQPAIPDLTFEPVSDGTATVVIVHVPSSADTPHFQVRQGSLRAPRRFGAQTVDMSERDIEQAYRARFEDRRVKDTALSELTNRLLAGIPREGRVWLTAAAVPINPRPAHLGRISREIGQDIFQDLRMSSPFLSPGNEHHFGYLNPNPRPGLRKWRANMAWSGDTRGAAEVHDRGAAALAWAPRPGDEMDAGQDIHIMDAHHFPVYVVQFLSSALDRLQISGGYIVQLMMHGADDSLPLYIRTFEYNHLIDKEGLTAIHGFAPVDSFFSGGSSRDLQEAVHSMALDVLNQAAIGETDTKYLRPL
jgi:hypothetical protein